MAKDFRITIDIPDVTGGDVDSIAADIFEVLEKFLDADFKMVVAQKQGDNFFTRDPGDDDLE